MFFDRNAPRRSEPCNNNKNAQIHTQKPQLGSVYKLLVWSMSTTSVINLRAKSDGLHDLRYTRIESTSVDCSARLACDIDTEGVPVSHSKPGSRARWPRTSIGLFLTCLGQRAASVADQLDLPPAALGLVSRTELSLSMLRPAQRSGARRAGYQEKTGGCHHARKSRYLSRGDLTQTAVKLH